MGKGFQNTAQQATEMGQAERQAGFYRTLMLWGRNGLHKFILNLIWLGLEREAERREGRGSQAHHLLCSTCPIAGGAASALLLCRALGWAQRHVGDCPRHNRQDGRSFVRSHSRKVREEDGEAKEWAARAEKGDPGLHAVGAHCNPSAGT